MEIIITKENKKSTYELTYDRDSIKNLIKEIIEKCSIRKTCKSEVMARSYKEAESIINNEIDWNGNKIHENVSSIKAEPINDPFDYWRPGDPAPYSFTSDKLFSPKLVSFLIDLLNGKSINYDWLINKVELKEKEELNKKIKELDEQINKINNFETTTKIKKLKELAHLIEWLNAIPNFDYDLLSKYYDTAIQCIELDLLEETITYPRRTKKQD